MKHGTSTWLILAGALATVAGCASDASAPVQPPTPRTNALPTLIASTPVQSQSTSAPFHMLGQNAPPTAGLVYVSLPPGSVPGGLTASVRDEASGQVIAAAVVDGGFDPVAITATIGDTLLVSVQTLGTVSATLGYLTVSASRPPVVVRTSPPPKKVDVPLNAFMVAVFNGPLDATTVNTTTVTLWHGATPVAGTVRFADAAQLRVEFHPDTLLAGDTDYQLILGKGIHDVNGVAFDSVVTVAFTTTSTAPAPVGIPWTPMASMPTPRALLAIGVVNGILYAVGGYNGQALGTVEAYDPATNTWTTKASMPTPRWGLAIGVVNGILYAVGGDTISEANGEYSVATVEAYDPAANSWTTKAAMPTPRADLAIGVVNGILYAAGGDIVAIPGPADFDARTPAVEAFDPATDTWTTKASMPTPRAGLAIGVVHGILYAVGGSGAVNGILFAVDYDSAGTVVAYDPAANSWTPKATMPTRRSLPSVGVVNGTLYAVGGFNNSGGVLGTLATYDAVTNSSMTRAETLTPRWGFAIGVVNGILYAVGGFSEFSYSSALGTVESLAP